MESVAGTSGDALRPALESLEVAPLEMERLRATLGAIPADVRTGLEIGFHELRVTDLLRREVDLVSIDHPRPVREGHGHKLAFADIASLPFPDDSFDIAFCCEVLEHLPDELIERGARELMRVARRYVLVTVPYRQRVSNNLFKCAGCGYVCNTMDHVQSLDEERLTRFFHGAGLSESALIGEVPGYAPDWLYRMANRLGNSWEPLIYMPECPGCRASSAAVRENPLGYALRRVIWRLERRAPRKPAWVLALFRLGADAQRS